MVSVRFIQWLENGLGGRAEDADNNREDGGGILLHRLYISSSDKLETATSLASSTPMEGGKTLTIYYYELLSPGVNETEKAVEIRPLSLFLSSVPTLRDFPKGPRRGRGGISICLLLFRRDCQTGWWRTEKWWKGPTPKFIGINSTCQGSLAADEAARPKRELFDKLRDASLSAGAGAGASQSLQCVSVRLVWGNSV